MKKYVRLTAAAICIAMLAGCGSSGDSDAMLQMTQEESTTNVEVENPTIQTISDEYMYSGTIQASQTVDVQGKVSGKVAATYYEVGDTVAAGAVLYKIDDTDYQNSLKSAQASLNTANASVRSAQTGVDTANGASMQTQIESAKNTITNAETSLETAKQSLDSAKITLDKAQSDYDIYKQLYDVGGVSEDTLNTYKNALDSAQNAYTIAELSVKSAEDALAQANTTYNLLVNETSEENLRIANDSLNSALAQQQASQVAVETAQQNISDCTVTSPISGVVLTKYATTGTMLSGVGYQIVDLSSVNVEVNASEQIATSVKVGDSVTIVIPSLDDRQFVGSISEIPPGSNSDGTYTIKINIPNESGDLMAGMFAEVYFAKSTSENAVIIPRDAVLDDDGSYYVYVADGDTAKRVDVTVGIDTGETIEITSGLTVSDKVITNGQTYLADGSKLNIVSDNGVSTVTTSTGTTTDLAEGEEDEQ